MSVVHWVSHVFTGTLLRTANGICRALGIIIIIIIIIIIVIIIIIISFMQSIYTYIPETNHVPREYSV